MADDQMMPAQTPEPSPDSPPEPTSGEAASTPPKKSPRKAAKGTKATKAGASKAAKAPKAKEAAREPAKGVGEGKPPAMSGPAPRKSTGTAQRKPRPAPRKAATSPPAPPAIAAQPSGIAAQPSGIAAQPSGIVAHKPGRWAEAAWEALRQPEKPPHRLAELAVAELGPRAAAWAGWLRRTYPGAPALGIARLAVQQAQRQQWALLAAEAAGPLAPALHLPGITAVRALLVLRVAAAYGHDPADPARAAELLDLLGLGEDATWFDRLSMLGTVFGRMRLWRRPASASRSAGASRPARAVRLVGALRLALTLGEERDQLERLAHRAALRYRAAGRLT